MFSTFLMRDSSDQWCSHLTPVAYNNSQIFCQQFMGTFNDTRIPALTIDWQYGPATGWWLCLAAIFCSVFAAIATIMTHR